MSYYGGLLGGINQTNKTLTSILTLSDGFTTISGGQITGTQSIETDNITINNTISVPEIITSNIQTQSGTLVIGDISDNITIYGSEIKLVGNVIGYESANVYIVDNRIELNSGGGNLLLPNSGISVLGDGNISVSSLLTDNNGDWVFSSPNNKLTVGSLNVANIAFDNLESANITATNKFFSPEKIITDRAVNRSSAISHINCKDIKASYIDVNKLTSQTLTSNILNMMGNIESTGNINTNKQIKTTGNINATFLNLLSGLSFGGDAPFKIDFGLTGTVTTGTTVSFTQNFSSTPVVVSTGFINSSNPPIVYIRGINSNSVNLYAKDDAGADYGSLRFFWVAIGF